MSYEPGPYSAMTPGEALRLRADVADLKRELAARARSEDEFRARCSAAAARYFAAHGHEPTCHATQHPDDPFEGCNCVVADIERGCMGDVVAFLMRVAGEGATDDDPPCPGYMATSANSSTSPCAQCERSRDDCERTRELPATTKAGA